MKSKDTLRLRLVLLLGLLLRLFDLGAKDIWHDEAISLLEALGPLKAAFPPFDVPCDFHPFTYSLFLHFWMHLGQSEWIVRLPSALAGTAALYFLYLIARELFNRETALTAALLGAVSPLWIYYSQDARMYIFHLFWSLGMIYFFLRWVKEPASLKLGIALAAFTLIDFYTHYFTVFYWLALNLYFLFLVPKNGKIWRNWLLIQGAVLLCFLPQLLFAFKQSRIFAETATFVWIPRSSLFHLYRVFLNFCFTFLQLHNNLLYPLVNKIWAGPFLLLLAVLGLLGLRNKEEKPGIVFLLCWLLIPLTLIYLGGLVHPMLVDRYLIGLLPPFLLLTACGIYQLKYRYLKAGVLTAALLLSLLSLQLYYGRYNIPQYPEIYLHSLKGLKDIRGMNDLLDLTYRENDLIVVDNASTYYPLYYYAGRRLRKQLFLYEFPGRYRQGLTLLPLDYFRQWQKARRILLVHSFWSWVPRGFEPEVKNWLDKNCRIICRIKPAGLDFFIFQAKTWPTAAIQAQNQAELALAVQSLRVSPSSPMGEKLLKAILNKDPYNEAACYNLAIYYLCRRQFAQGCNQLEKMLQLRPDMKQVYLLMIEAVKQNPELNPEEKTRLLRFYQNLQNSPGI